jgi:GAF domain-containing protein
MHVAAAISDDDEDRVNFLRSLQILDSPSDESFDRITNTAKSVLRVPIALISFVDSERQWFKSKVGLNVCETHRDYAFCSHAILPKIPTVLIVPDATQDDRFRYSPLVLGEPFIRFYAGAPLIFMDKDTLWKIGTLCVIDVKPRTFERDQILLLETLSRLVVAEIRLRKSLADEQAERIRAMHRGARACANKMHASYIGQVNFTSHPPP